MPPIRRKTLQTVTVEPYRTHDGADRALTNLVKKISLTRNDPSYTQKVVPFLKTLEPADVQKVGKLVDNFINTGMTKENFKDGWRALQPGTDEHFSTQNVYTLLETIRSNNLHKSSVNLGVLKDTLSVISYFRLPTEYTGHSSGRFRFAHPRGNKLSPYIPSNKSPSHSTFDMLRRTLAVAEGEAQHSAAPKDGAGIYLSMLSEAVKFSINFTASPFASDVSVLSNTSTGVKLRAFDLRELMKRRLNPLRRGGLNPLNNNNVQVQIHNYLSKNAGQTSNSLNSNTVQTQSQNAPQYSQYSSPADKSLVTTGKRKRARSPSPERVPNNAILGNVTVGNALTPTLNTRGRPKTRSRLSPAPSS